MKYILCICFLLSGMLTFSQDCHLSIKGFIIDKHDGTPLSAARISVYDSNKEVLSNENGSFVVNGLCKGLIELEISHQACGTQFISLNLQQNIQETYYLEHHVEALEEVALIQSKKEVDIKRSLSAEILAEVAGENFADALTKIQGISTLKTGNAISKPLIQGFYGSRVLTNNQGVRMQDMEWGDEHAPNIATAAVNKVSLVTGAAALRYGTDAVGGVLVLAPKTPSFKDQWVVKSSLYGQSNGQGIQTIHQIEKNDSKGRLWGIQFDYKRAGNTQTPQSYMENTALEQISLAVPLGVHKASWGLDAYLSYFKANNAILRNSHIGNTTDLIAQINGVTPTSDPGFSYNINNPKQEVQHLLAKFSLYKRWEDLGKLSIQYDFQQNNRKEYDLRLGERRNVPGTDLQLQTHGLHTVFKVQTPQTKTLEFGLDAKYQIHFPNPDTGVKRLIPDYESSSLAGFVFGETQWTPELKISGSLRAEILDIQADKYYKKSRWEALGYDSSFSSFFVEEFSNQILTAPSFSFPTFSGALSAIYEKNRALWQFHYQYVERAPNPAELFSEGLHHSAARIELGSLETQKEGAHKLSFQYNRMSSQNEWFISPFFNHINNYIALIATDVEYTIRGAFPVWQYTQTTAQFIGIDSRYSRSWTENFKTNHGISVVKAKDVTNNSPFPNIPPISSLHSLEAKIPAIPGIKIQLEGNYVFEQNETPENILVFDPYDQKEVVLAINDSEPAYFLLGTAISYQWKKNQKNYSLRVIGNNLTHLTYHNYLNRLRYFSPEMGRNIQLQFTVNF